MKRKTPRTALTVTLRAVLSGLKTKLSMIILEFGPDDDARVVDEADLREAVWIGDDRVAHEHVAVRFQHPLAAWSGGICEAIDLDDAAARLERIALA